MLNGYGMQRKLTEIYNFEILKESRYSLSGKGGY